MDTRLAVRLGDLDVSNHDAIEFDKGRFFQSIVCFCNMASSIEKVVTLGCGIEIKVLDFSDHGQVDGSMCAVLAFLERSCI